MRVPQALGCLADMVKCSNNARHKLRSSQVTAGRSGVQIMLLQAILRTALYSDDKDEQPSAADLLRMFCQSHREGQQALSATLLSSTLQSEPGAKVLPKCSVMLLFLPTYTTCSPFLKGSKVPHSPMSVRL